MSTDAFDRARRVIAVQALAGVVAGVLVAGLATVGLVLVGQHREVQSQLTALLSVPDARAVPSGTWVVSVDGSGRRTASVGAPASLPTDDDLEQARRGGEVDREAYVEDGEYQTRTRKVGERVVQAGVDLAQYESERHRLLIALVVAGAVAALVALVAGGRLGRRAVGVWDDALLKQRQFIADASHELRTPLARLALRADLLHDALRRDPPAAELAPDVDLLRREAAALADIVEDLLHAAEVHASPDAGELVDLAALVEEVLDLEHQLAAQRGVELLADVNLVAPVRGAFPALRRVVDALVDNALHHAHSTVTVRLRDDGDDVVLTVADDGPGLDPAAASRVFDRFAKDPSSPGFGLGLALVREVVERHAGTVGILPVERGTTFEVRLPAENAPTPDALAAVSVE
ncbi:MAG: HAMP domain-containing sensor histidine kinase [Pedococcus sp.]